MAERGGKPKKAKADANVLASLPSTRPNRLGRARGEAKPATVPAAGSPPKPRPAAKPEAAAKRKAAATPRAAPKRKAAAMSKPAREATPKPRAAPPSVPSPEPRGPRPVRAGAPTLSDAPSPQDRPDAPPSGAELASTVVKAAGELAQIGLTVGGQVLKRAVQKLPKP